MSEEPGLESRVEALLRRSDGHVLIRPLDLSRHGRVTTGRVLAEVFFVLVIVVAGVVAVGVINVRRQPVATTPSAPVLATSAPTATVRPLRSFGANFATPDEAAAAVAQALEHGDRQLLLSTLASNGWYAQWYAQAQTDAMSQTQAWNWISSNTTATWHVDTGTLYDRDASMPSGDKYITAAVSDFNQWPEQRAAIMLQAVAGRWYWSSLLLYRPPPIESVVGEVAGYATLLTITDASVSVHFRTLGSRCCSDPSWSDRTVVLRRGGGTIYMRPGGDRATSLADSGSGIGADVWVRFSLSSLAPDGSYGLTDLVKMYP